MSRTYRRKKEELGWRIFTYHWYETKSGWMLVRVPMVGDELKKAKIRFHTDRDINWSPDPYLRNLFQRMNRRQTKAEIRRNLTNDSFDDYCTSDVGDLSWYY